MTNDGSTMVRTRDLGARCGHGRHEHGRAAMVPPLPRSTPRRLGWQERQNRISSTGRGTRSTPPGMRGLLCTVAVALLVAACSASQATSNVATLDAPALQACRDLRD